MSVNIPTNPEPLCLAMLLCDYAVRDEDTGKTTLHGIFDTISPADLPFTCDLTIYLVLTDARGHKRLDLRIAAPEEVLTAEIPGPPTEPGPYTYVQFSDPLEIVELMPRMTIKISAHGLAVIQLFADGTFVAERRLHVVPRAS